MKIPAGIDDGMRIRSTGNGEPGTNGGPPGDLYIEIRLKKHELFERDGDDLHCVVPVSITTAALGGEIDVPTLKGAAAIDIPDGTQSGKQFRLRGKGIKGVRSSYPGDLYCHIARGDAGQAHRAPAQAAEGTRRVAQEGRRQAQPDRQGLVRQGQRILQLNVALPQAAPLRVAPPTPSPGATPAARRSRFRGVSRGAWLRRPGERLNWA